jgi:hypothetical protein
LRVVEMTRKPQHQPQHLPPPLQHLQPPLQHLQQQYLQQHQPLLRSQAT